MGNVGEEYLFKYIGCRQPLTLHTKLNIYIQRSMVEYRLFIFRVLRYIIDQQICMSFDVSEISDHHTITQYQVEQEIEQEKKNPAYKFQPPLKTKILVAYLYFIQGVVMVLPATMTLVYDRLPSYQVLSIFSAANMPFSTKFIVAPFIQKYTILSYGKRKTWIIISQLSTSLLLFIASFYTSQEYQVSMGIMMVTSVFFIALQDISLDALAIKQLRQPNLVGMLQAIMSTLGVILGSLILLKSTSKEFAKNISLHEPIANPSTIFRIISVCLLVPTFLIHQTFIQTSLNSEKKIMRKTFCEIIRVYRKFFDCASRFSLTFFLLLTFTHGFTYFEAGYEYELIKAGFVKNTLNTITNVSLVPISVATIWLSQKIDAKSDGNLNKLIMLFLSVKLILFVWIYWVFPTSVASISFVYFSLQALEMMKFVLISIFVNNFPVTGISGMTITMLVSASNLGNQKSLGMLMTGYFGWRNVAIFGLLIQAVAVGMFPKMYKRAEQAQCDIGFETNENSQDESNQQDSISLSDKIPNEGASSSNETITSQAIK